MYYLTFRVINSKMEFELHFMKGKYMDLRDRAMYYFVASIPLLIIHGGIVIIICLWLHFAWCVDQRKKQYKRQKKNLHEMIVSGKVPIIEEHLRSTFTKEEIEELYREKARRRAERKENEKYE